MSRKETPVGSLLTFVPGKFRTRIRTVTARHSLSPTSFTRIPVGLPCGSLSPKGEIRAYHVSHKYLTDRLGSALTPVALHLR
ncbi:hypothetical protein [Desulfonema magnum]|uniref:hypothetical protein n=1 Tax=Desulfonema magnum TaxID=45655 RepID=UPI001A9B9171|nr:hypothetical protein [Desulfonema magnum]